MAQHNDSYSRFVAWAKVILPLIALGLFSTLFLLSETKEPGDGIPYAAVEIEELAREQRVTAPEFSGVTEDGASIAVSADHASPSLEDLQTVQAENISATWINQDGARLDISALDGVLFGSKGRVDLENGVEILSSNGYLITAPDLSLGLKTTELTSMGPIRAIGPLGVFDAGQMELILKNQQYLMVFSKGVKLIYTPEEASGD
ncbi:MAG: LPS export ABC transporter periplasmic protein LptC [Pseudoruegeria sp.]